MYDWIIKTCTHTFRISYYVWYHFGQRKKSVKIFNICKQNKRKNAESFYEEQKTFKKILCNQKELTCNLKKGCWYEDNKFNAPQLHLALHLFASVPQSSSCVQAVECTQCNKLAPRWNNDDNIHKKNNKDALYDLFLFIRDATFILYLGILIFFLGIWARFFV